VVIVLDISVVADVFLIKFKVDVFFGVLGFIDRFLLHVTSHDSIVNFAQKPGKKCRR